MDAPHPSVPSRALRRPAGRVLTRTLLLLLFAVVASLPSGAEPIVWVDAQGVTHVTNDPEAVPEEARATTTNDLETMRGLWVDGLQGPPIETPAGSSSTDDSRIVRLLRGAVSDLKRGESARAGATLRSVLRLEPGRPEAHWYLALLNRQRGRYDTAEAHLRAFLGRAGGESMRAWREQAKGQLAALAQDRRLADPKRARPPLELAQHAGRHFRVEVDREIAGPASQYAVTAMGFLEEARAEVAAQLAVAPSEPLGVVFYGKAAYQRAHAHRFSFQTVGFYDGKIHVVSPAHPSPALRALLFHEYTHAVYREQTGGDRPYWLNEGLAEQVERRARKQPISTRSERASIHARILAGEWIPLRRIAASFGGLADDDARAAYLQSILAAEWLEARTSAEQRSHLLQQLGRGISIDQALYEVVGHDTDALDLALQKEISSEFPSY